jgi:hypothetical protein
VTEDLTASFLRLDGAAEDLARDITSAFADAVDVDVGVAVVPATDVINGVALGAVAMAPDGRTAVRRGLAALRGSYSGFDAVVAVAGAVGAAVMNPLMLGLTLLTEAGAVRQEQRDQLESRRDDANEAVTRFIDDVGFHVVPELRRAVRAVHRELRETLRGWAAQAERSASESLAAAERMVSADDATRAERLPQVEAALDTAGELLDAARALSPESVRVT